MRLELLEPTVPQNYDIYDEIGGSRTARGEILFQQLQKLSLKSGDIIVTRSIQDAGTIANCELPEKSS